MSSNRAGYILFRLSIQDFGCGMSEEALNSLFIDFNNNEEHRSINPNGRGLGLSICKMIIEKMAGKISVHSELNKGTTFTV